MPKRCSAFLVAVVFLGTGGIPRLASSQDDPGRPDGATELRHTLIFREEQGGVAGIGGTIWRVEPDGEWSVAKFRRVDGQDREIEGTRRVRKLKPERMAALARGLDVHRFLDWPDRLGHDGGRADGVNRHGYLIQFGDRRTVLDGVKVRRGESVRRNILQGSPPMGDDEFRLLGGFADLAAMIVDNRE